MSESTTTTITRWDELTEAGRQAVGRGDLAAATTSYRGALEEADATAPESARVASSLASLGQVRYQAKEYAEAEQLFRRALALRERLLGAEHPTVAQTLNNLAAVHVALGTLDAAEPLLLRALGITERHRGPSHPDVAVNLNNLAKLYFKRNEHARAEPLLVRLLELEKVASPAHPKIASVLTSLASVRMALGDLVSAEALIHEAESIVGTQHASVAAARARLDAVRSGRLTPTATSGAIDQSTVSGPVSLSESDAPPRRRSGSLPPNPWLAESEPPSVIAAESGEYDAAPRPTRESTVIVPTTSQEPIAPPRRTEAPAPLPPLVVPAQVPREFADSWGREATEGASVVAAGRQSVEMRAPVLDEPTPGLVAPAPPIKEGPSLRPTSAHIEAAAAAIARFAPPPERIMPAAPTPPPAPAAAPAPAVPIKAASRKAPQPRPAPAKPVPMAAEPVASAPTTAAPIAAAIAPPAPAPVLAPLVAPPLIPPPAPSTSSDIAIERAPVAIAPTFDPPMAYAPPPLAPAAPASLALEHELAPLPPVASLAPLAPASPERRATARSSEGPRFAPESHERPAPRKPRIQPDGTTSSGGMKVFMAALVVAALAAGAWFAFGRGNAAPTRDDDIDAPAASTAPALSPNGGTSASNAPMPAATPPASTPSPTTGVSTPAPAPAQEEITSSPVPMSRREEPRVEAPRPAPVVPTIALPSISTDLVTRGIDSTAKARVDATLRPKVAQPTFAKPSP